MSTVCRALCRWPDHARACCGELWHRRVPGGVKGVELKMVAKFGTLGQTGEASTREQSALRHSERVDTQAWHGGHAWSPRELFPQASLRPKIMSGMLFVVVLKFTMVWFASRCSREDFTS